MISRLKGNLEEKTKNSVVIDVNGVCYGASITEIDYLNLPEIGEPLVMDVSTYVREDALSLFAFTDRLNLRLFEFLIKASGVGPKLALVVLGMFEGEQLLDIIQNGSVAQLQTVPGIGKKKAERILLELKDKVEKTFGADAWIKGSSFRKSSGAKRASKDWSEDLLPALESLGYKTHAVKKTVMDVLSKPEAPEAFEEAFRQCLQNLSGANFSARQGQA